MDQAEIPSAGGGDTMAARDGLDPSLRASRWRHRKTGGTYTIIGQCRIEATGADAFLYQGTDGTIWARPKEEFLDGRFERL
ncbi:DUF1653 domain-containing protein [Polymorphum gilvum]|uniref:Uncharacterized protein n=1 Tax=Polymorphum gilvum (strain LMG 25793 / CGMCC 1.9160 / SL003B-26A1) TaxID=991905 RepID=F2IZV9_POLGS|nr:DUF1653 domain-containing protein [Polymorphum gilvum]ADZ70685.1 hypothetical protein SL003B_2260 [Polymorphum gilvum SL003B-26A1]